MSAATAPRFSAVAITARLTAGFSPARGTAHASIEPLSCSLLIPLRFAIRLPGWSSLKCRLALLCCERANQHFSKGKRHGYTHSKPTTAFRSGSVNVAIWENTGEKGAFFSVTFSRPYKDTQGNWKVSSSYGLNDLDALSSLAELAKDWVRGHSLQ